MKNIIVTGVSRGIGLAVAQTFLAKGYKVFGTSTSGNSPLTDANFECIPLKLNDSASIKAFYKTIQNHSIDGIINNAAILLENWSQTAVDMDQLRQTFEVNVFGTIDLTESLLPLLNNGGRIISLSSGWGTFSESSFDATVPHYKMSKTVLNMYTKLLAKRLESRSIVVSAVNPGWVRTDMGGGGAPVQPQEVGQRIVDLFENNTQSGHLWYNGKISEW
ncbi:MAG TPA: SDR family oxidoreductase [Microscillaceae bacterium]|nr:SDR family oxidoreductase [Microscillaceae bacterium]